MIINVLFRNIEHNHELNARKFERQLKVGFNQQETQWWIVERPSKKELGKSDRMRHKNLSIAIHVYRKVKSPFNSSKVEWTTSTIYNGQRPQYKWWAFYIHVREYMLALWNWSIHNNILLHIKSFSSISVEHPSSPRSLVEFL